MSLRSPHLTGEQIRAARALLRIEQTELAETSGLSVETIKRLERIRGKVDAKGRTMLAILSAFETFGVTFEVEDDGGVGICRAAGRPSNPSPGRSRASLRPRQAERSTGELYRLIYCSRARPWVAEKMSSVLYDIGEAACRRNKALSVTGVLFAQDGVFLQALEGPKLSVQQIYGAISSDPRHEGQKVIESRAVPVRQFPDWTLCCGVFPGEDDALMQEPELKDGFHPERLTVSGALGLLCIVRELQAFPPRSRRGLGEACTLTANCFDRFCTGRLVDVRMAAHAS